jgi:hypothetical protein
VHLKDLIQQLEDHKPQLHLDQRAQALHILQDHQVISQAQLVAQAHIQVHQQPLLDLIQALKALTQLPICQMFLMCHLHHINHHKEDSLHNNLMHLTQQPVHQIVTIFHQDAVKTLI